MGQPIGINPAARHSSPVGRLCGMALLEPVDHVAALVRAADLLLDLVIEIGRPAPVPTCPGWTSADLLAHQGMVHRWARGQLVQPRPDRAEREAFETAPTAPADLPDWYRAGLAALLATLAVSDDNTPGRPFLADAGSPNRFWCRRQAHETTIHSVDALSARLGRLPDSSEVGLDPKLAADGIDELLCGFLPRERSRLRSERPFTLLVQPTDVTQSWSVRIGPDRPRTERTGTTLPDATFCGSAVGLYLGLWNRGQDFEIINPGGPVDLAQRWRAGAAVTMS